jgi:hypothetical protein
MRAGRVSRPLVAGGPELRGKPVAVGLVKTEWFKRYRPSELPERFDRIVQSWDTANSGISTGRADHRCDAKRDALAPAGASIRKDPR